MTGGSYSECHMHAKWERKKELVTSNLIKMDEEYSQNKINPFVAGSFLFIKATTNSSFQIPIILDVFCKHTPVTYIIFIWVKRL